jgi:hypothetical protein
MFAINIIYLFIYLFIYLRSTSLRHKNRSFLNVYTKKSHKCHTPATFTTQRRNLAIREWLEENLNEGPCRRGKLKVAAVKRTDVQFITRLTFSSMIVQHCINVNIIWNKVFTCFCYTYKILSFHLFQFQRDICL